MSLVWMVVCVKMCFIVNPQHNRNTVHVNHEQTKICYAKENHAHLKVYDGHLVRSFELVVVHMCA